jgi:hypothetical protein
MLKGLFSTGRAPAAQEAPPAAGAAPSGRYAYPLKLNLGCGYHRLEGYLNVDHFAGAKPDLVMDMESMPWPFPDSSVTHVELRSVLEHVGQDSKTFLAIIAELWRVCAPGAEVNITVPHPRHDHFLGDPTHVRAILPSTLQAFDQVMNREWIDTGNAATPLGLQLGVDFHLDSVAFVLDEQWLKRMQAGEVNSEQVMAAAQSQNNVIAELACKWVAQKPPRG